MRRAREVLDHYPMHVRGPEQLGEVADSRPGHAAAVAGPGRSQAGFPVAAAPMPAERLVARPDRRPRHGPRLAAARARLTASFEARSRGVLPSCRRSVGDQPRSSLAMLTGRPLHCRLPWLCHLDPPLCPSPYLLMPYLTGYGGIALPGYDLDPPHPLPRPTLPRHKLLAPAYRVRHVSRVGNITLSPSS